MRMGTGVEVGRHVALICAAALLAVACASGGGGSTSPSVSTRLLPAALRGQTFQAMSATYSISGSSQTDYSELRDVGDPTGRGTRIDTSASGDSLVVTVTRGPTFNETLTLPPPGETRSGTQPAFPEPDGNVFYYPAENGNLSYVSFGEWYQRLDITRTGSLFAFGHITPIAGIPTVGTATYNGSFHGVAIEGLGTRRIDGTLTGNANFATRSVSINTTNPVDPSYNLIGVLGYGAGSNAISGSLRTDFVAGPGFGYTGNAVARFFGPNAEELGGAFRLTRSQTFCFPTCFVQEHAYMGAFGAKR